MLALLTVSVCACGGGGDSAPAAPTPTASSITPTPTPTPTSGAALAATYTTSYQNAQATPFPGGAPIQLFAQGQSAIITVSGGVPPYGGQLLFCTSGQGFGSPFTFMQNANLASFTLMATQYAGSCTVYIADSSNPNKSIQLQATLTTTSGTVQ